MTFPLRRYERGGRTIYQPIIPIVVKGIGDFDALLDTGSDVTHFPYTGPKSDRIHHVTGIGKSNIPVPLANARKELMIQQDGVVYRWETDIGLSDNEKPVLGYGGFLEYFTFVFNPVKKEFSIEPTKNYPGTVNNFWT